MKKKISVVSLCVAMLITTAFGSSAMAASGESTMSDSWITAKTKMSLAADGRVEGRQVSVETDKGEVILRGKVNTEEAKTAAGEIATGIDNVKGVKNELQVVAPVNRDIADDKDDVITARVKRCFYHERALRKANIGVVTNAGVVSLTGEVPSFMTSAKASWEAWKLPGVKSVKNDLTVKDKARN